jgi:hypothetical protein
MDNMNKQDYTLYIYKKDKRTKSGERLVQTRVCILMRKKEMEIIAGAYRGDLRAEYVPSMMTVKSLMTGQEVQIEHDTPWCCNPASETFWSM